jgi:hypothetical protein
MGVFLGITAFGPICHYWSLLEHVTDANTGILTAGRPDEGTYKFKERWGAKPTSLHWYKHFPNGKPVDTGNIVVAG